MMVSANVCYSKIFINPKAFSTCFGIYFVYLQGKPTKTTDERSKSRKQTCLDYALQGGRKLKVKYDYEDSDFTGLSES